MTIQPNQDEFIVHCDFCSNYLEVEGDFEDALKEMKFYGWKTLWKDGDWVNQCPACQEEG